MNEHLSASSLVALLLLAGACRGDSPPPESPATSEPAVVATSPTTDEPRTAEDAAAPAPEDAATAAPTARGADGWYKVAPKGEGFTVEMPGEPTRQMNDVQGPQGHAAKLVQYMYSSDDEVLIASASPLVAQLVEHGNMALALDRTLATQIDQPGRTLRYKKELTLGEGVVGREAELDVMIEGQPARLRIRMFIQGMHIFQVLAIWPPGGETAPASVERFFGSFALTGDQSAIGAAIDLWMEHTVPELGLVVTLPKKPDVEATADAETFLGKTSVTTMSAQSSFPLSIYTLDLAQVPADQAATKDAELFELWKKARLEAIASEGPAELLREEAASLLGLEGKLVAFKSTTSDGVERHGQLIAAVEREGGSAKRMYVASVWAAEAKELPELAKRFFGGIKRAP